MAGLVVVAGCGGGDPAGGGGMNVTQADAPSRVVDAPDGLYLAATWMRDDRVVVDVQLPGDDKRSGGLRVMGIDGSGLRELDPRLEDRECLNQRQSGARNLPDGRLGFLDRCEFEALERGERTRLYAWDLEREPELLVETDEPMNGYTLRDGLREGLYDIDSSICAGIGEIRGGELRPLDLKLPGEDWSLGAAIAADGSDCGAPDIGRAREPAYSPDSRRIGFTASPQSVGAEGQARLDAPWNLYVMDAEDREPEAIVEDVQSLSGPLWSPDGKWLAFNGEIDGDAGVFIVGLEAREVVAITDRGEDGATAWSPDGRELLIVRTPGLGENDELPERSELVRFDVSKIVGR